MVNSGPSQTTSDTDVVAHDARTRDRILAVISERGPITAAAVADHLQLTATGVRRHLDHLAEAGSVASRAPHQGKRGRGRPAREWIIGDSGHEHLGTDYDGLATEALRFLREQAGDQAVRDFADRRFALLTDRIQGRVAAVGTDPRKRVEVLVEALRAEGYAASARPVEGTSVGVQLCQGHCPVQHVAAEFPQLCEAETDAFSRLLGVHVQRLATLAQGNHVCTTFVPTPGMRPNTERSTR